jgi:DNA-binding MarR family transcriptional regulator
MHTMRAPEHRSADLTDRQYQSLSKFRHALRVFLRFSELSARRVGLTPAQHQLLLAVRGWPEPSPPSVGDLAVLLQTRPHSTLELIRRVEKAGLLRIHAADDDRRRQLVTLSRSGQRKLAELSVTHRDELRRFRKEMNQILDELE